MQRDNLIEKIKGLHITQDTDKFQLDNLDWCKLVETDEGVMVENEHGTTFDLDELNDVELSIVEYLFLTRLLK